MRGNPKNSPLKEEFQEIGYCNVIRSNLYGESRCAARNKHNSMSTLASCQAHIACSIERAPDLICQDKACNVEV
jgi:hypothetical protein